MKTSLQKMTLVALALCSSAAFAQDNTSSTRSDRNSDNTRNAGLFVEPMIVGESSDTSIKTSSLPLLSDTSGSLKGGGLGLRLGGHVGEVVFLAADGRYNRNDFNDSTYEKTSSAGYNYGATLGAQTPFFGIRVWGTNVFGGDVDPAAGARGVDVKFTGARGYRVGGGIHIAAVAVNLEYQDLTYGNTQIQSFGNQAVNEDTKIDFTQRGTILSLSFPMEL